MSKDEKGACPCCDGSGVLTQDHHTMAKEDKENSKGHGTEGRKLATKAAKHFMDRVAPDESE